jgi:hypothetical protein
MARLVSNQRTLACEARPEAFEEAQETALASQSGEGLFRADPRYFRGFLGALAH